MRLKKVKNANAIISKSNYIIEEPEKFKGKFKEIFGNDNPIDVEIGMGKGDFVIGMAKKNPNVNFIGVEMFDSVIVRAVQKLENEKIDNLRLIKIDANDINQVFNHEIRIVYLNFSDPWPKKRHAKRRLTSHTLLEKYDNIFKGEKIIFQKTDNVDLFTYSIESLSTYGYVLKNISLDLHKDNSLDNVMTEYEKKFKSIGTKICRLEAYKK